MLTTFFFAVVFCWLIFLSLRQAEFSHWLKTMQEERSRVLAFIEKAKASRPPVPAGEVTE